MKVLKDRASTQSGQSSSSWIRAFLYDAEGSDREIEISEARVDHAAEHQLLWVDAAVGEEGGDDQVWRDLGLDPERVDHVLTSPTGPAVEVEDGYFWLIVTAVPDDDGSYRPTAVRAMVGSNWILTMHPPGFDLIGTFNRPIKGETDLGALDGPVFLASLLNWLLNGYFHVLQDLEDRVDDLDERLLTRGVEVKEDDLLRELVKSRRRIARLRRILAPHRDVFAVMAEPEANAFIPAESSGSYERLAERLDKAIGSADHAREVLMGSFEVFMTMTAERTNDVMKILTMVSVLLLPSAVIAGIMGMNFQIGFFRHAWLFWLTIGVMGGIAVATLVVARWRKWL
jgi:Mg2+ and Co2+ transporter CorA